MEAVRRSLKRLSEIALSTKTTGVADYVDLLILAEENEATPGYLDRIKQLQELRSSIGLATQIADNQDDTDACISPGE